MASKSTIGAYRQAKWVEVGVGLLRKQVRGKSILVDEEEEYADIFTTENSILRTFVFW